VSVLVQNIVVDQLASVVCIGEKLCKISFKPAVDNFTYIERRNPLVDVHTLKGTVGIKNFITGASFGIDRFKGFRSAMGRNWPFPMLNQHCQ
jgi:hypothetical protein